jgi:hypothetical protein
VTALVRLYPRAWRDRYEDEFLAVLADRPPRFGDRLDILLNALDAHLDPEVPETPAETRRGHPVRVAPSAILAAIGGLLWILALASIVTGPIDADGFHAADLGLFLILVAQVALGGAAFTLADRLYGQRRLLTGAGAVLLAGAGLFFFGWPLLPLGLYAGLLASMAVGAAVIDRGGRLVGLWLVVGSLVAFGMNTGEAYALFGLPMALGWIAVGVWSLGDRAPQTMPQAPG